MKSVSFCSISSKFHSSGLGDASHQIRCLSSCQQSLSSTSMRRDCVMPPKTSNGNISPWSWQQGHSFSTCPGSARSKSSRTSSHNTSWSQWTIWVIVGPPSKTKKPKPSWPKWPNSSKRKVTASGNGQCSTKTIPPICLKTINTKWRPTSSTPSMTPHWLPTLASFLN